MSTIEKNWGHFRLKPDLWGRLKEIATKERRTQTEVLNRALEEYLDRNEQDLPPSPTTESSLSVGRSVSGEVRAKKTRDAKKHPAFTNRE